MYLAKRDAVSVAELCDLIYALAAEARSVGNLTRYSPTSWCQAGVQTLIESLNSVLAVHQATKALRFAQVRLITT